MASDQDLRFMREAIRLQRAAGLLERSGGAFGAVVVKDGAIIGACGNSVIRDIDPTAHAEVMAIRQACRTLNSIDLSGAVLYSSCECCPMCYGAAYWARLSKIFYAASWSDYDDLFDDSHLDADIRAPYHQRLLNPEPLLRSEAQAVWAEFRALPGAARY